MHSHDADRDHGDGDDDDDDDVAIEIDEAVGLQPSRPSNHHPFHPKKSGLQRVPPHFLKYHLIHACQSGDVEQVKLILGEAVEPLSFIDAVCLHHDQRWTALGLASSLPSPESSSPEYEEIVKMLLNKGANPNVRARGTSESTPLILFASRGNVAMISMLLKSGADVDAVDSDNNTALIAAVNNGHKKCIEVLLKHGPVLVSNGDTPDHDKITRMLSGKRSGIPEHAQVAGQKAAAQSMLPPADVMLEIGGSVRMNDHRCSLRNDGEGSGSLGIAAQTSHEFAQAARQSIGDDGDDAELDELLSGGGGHGDGHTERAQGSGSGHGLAAKDGRVPGEMAEMVTNEALEVARRQRYRGIEDIVANNQLGRCRQRDRDNSSHGLEMVMKCSVEFGPDDKFNRLIHPLNLNSPIQLLMRRFIGCANRKFADDQTPIIFAARIGRKDMVKFLLDVEPLPNLEATFETLTALGWAAQKDENSPDHREIVEMLLEKNAHPDGRQTDSRFSQQTPLMWYAKRDNVIMIVKLLKRGASVNAVTSVGDDGNDTALMIAATNGKVKAVAALLEHNPELEVSRTTCRFGLTGTFISEANPE